MSSRPPSPSRAPRRSAPAPAPAASHPLQALARFVVALSVAVNTGLCVLLIALGASTWWVELLRYLPYLLILVPALLALLLSFTLGWGWRAMALASLVLTLGPLMGWVEGTPESGVGPRLRVMSYNIKSYKAEDRPEGYGPLVLEIRRHDPDVLLMQDAQLLTKPGLAIPAPMAQLLESYPHVDRRNQYVIASRHPLRGCRTVALAEPPGRGHFQHCRLTIEQRELELVNVHLLSPREGLNAARHDQLGGLDDWKINYGQRLAQALRLADELGRGRATGADRQPLPLIVAGDLNAPQSSPVVRSLLALGLRDAWAIAGRGYGYTHGHSLRPHLSFLRIDHLLVDSSLAVGLAEVGGAEASEHRPVIAELRLDRQGR